MKAGAFLISLLYGMPAAFAAGSGDFALDKASLDNDVTSVYGAECEKIKSGEARSTVRVRVTDKASYMAVSRLPDLKNARVELNEHEFNVMVYHLVDNNIEDMAVRTTKQTPEEICVEVTGYISGKNIFAAIDDALNRQKETPEENEPEESAPEDIKEEISQEVEQPPAAKDVSRKAAVYQPDETILPAPEPGSLPSAETPKDTLADAASRKGLIYIAPTEFFNNTSSSKYAEILRQMFVKSDYFYITENPDLADFIINSRVLRAKVDPINSDTNRMQMVVAVESQNTDSGEKEIEHQNRFVLFAGAENEQKVAAKLMKQLLEKAADKIITQLEIFQRKKNKASGLPPVITPAPASLPKRDGR